MTPWVVLSQYKAHFIVQGQEIPPHLTALEKRILAA